MNTSTDTTAWKVNQELVAVIWKACLWSNFVEKKSKVSSCIVLMNLSSRFNGYIHISNTSFHNYNLKPKLQNAFFKSQNSGKIPGKVLHNLCADITAR